MKQSPLLPFPVSEYETRLQKVIAAMGKAGIDALVLTSDENTYYFSGFNSIVWDSKVSTPGTVVITGDGSIMLATSSGGRYTAGATSCVDDIRYYGSDGYATYVKAIVSLLEEKSLLKSAKIGFELGNGHKMHLNYTLTRELFNELSDDTIVDASAALWEVRCIKSPLEIEYLRKASSINVRAIQHGFDVLREGMTEMDLYDNIMSEYFRLGAQRALPIGVRAGKDRYSQSNCPPGFRPIRKGDIILVDGGPIYQGYYSDIIREAVIGSPTPHQLDVFNIAREACYAGIDAIRPGRPINEVCKVVDDYLDNSKYAPLNVYHGWCGHGIGAGVHESPMLDAQTTTLLQPGMTFAIEPYIFEDGVGSLGIEENVLVTESGCEIMSKSNSELIIL